MIITSHVVSYGVITGLSSPAFAQLPFYKRHDPTQPAIPIGKDIDVVNFASDPPRHAALVEPHRNQEGFVQWNALGAIESIADLGLERSLFPNRLVRETSDEEIRGLDG